MSRLIDLETKEMDIMISEVRDKFGDFVTVKVKELLEELPTVDAVPVVRCKDCKWLDSDTCRCDFISLDCFCSFGERKEDE